jgi:hypothetical protein
MKFFILKIENFSPVCYYKLLQRDVELREGERVGFNVLHTTDAKARRHNQGGHRDVILGSQCLLASGNTAPKSRISRVTLMSDGWDTRRAYCFAQIT